MLRALSERRTSFRCSLREDLDNRASNTLAKPLFTMATQFCFEAEPLELSQLGSECFCGKCQSGSRPDPELATETGLWANTYNGKGEQEMDEVLFEDLSIGPLDCSTVAVNCNLMTADEQRRVRRAGRPGGDLLDRTQGDPDKNLSLQLTDYDVNDWLVAKERHKFGLERILRFIGDRVSQITALPTGIEITVTGSSSRTGGKQYNDVLSCKRAKCVEGLLREMLLEPGRQGRSLLGLNKIKFTVGGNGFQNAKCRRRKCEVGEYRSVLISVHRPGLAPPPVPVVPPSWDKYRIRCCSYKTENLGEALIGDLISRGIEALPNPVRRLLNSSDSTKKGLSRAVKALISKLKDLLKGAPGAFGRLFGAIAKGLPVPVEFIRDTGVFQIIERDKPHPNELILCYTGFGFRVTFPRSIPGFERLVPKALRDSLRKYLKEHLKIEGLGVDIFFDAVSGKVSTIESTIPGQFTDFDVAPKIRLRDFEGSADVVKGIELGTVIVAFNSLRSFKQLDPGKRPRITCSPRLRCEANLVPVRVGPSTGFEVLAPTTGELVDGACECETRQKDSVSNRTALARVLELRQAALRKRGANPVLSTEARSMRILQ
jgi:hypothetical protein